LAYFRRRLLGCVVVVKCWFDKKLHQNLIFYLVFFFYMYAIPAKISDKNIVIKMTELKVGETPAQATQQEGLTKIPPKTLTRSAQENWRQIPWSLIATTVTSQ
jgi:hypothetical protein